MTARGIRASHTLVFILTAAISLYSNSAAQMPGPPGFGGPPPDREEMLKRFDTDGDGRLSDAEREAMRDAMPGFMGRGGRRGPGGMRSQALKIAEQFDADGDGRLNDEERKAAREYVQGERGNMKVSRVTQKEEATVDPTQVGYHPDAELYDETVLRTLFLEFPNEDWFEEMGDFHKTDVDVPADLTVDGVTYPGVGVRFRGNSSYMTGNSDKNPFNISIDYSDPKQRLYGYKTLNLLNGHSDVSFMREVLYSKICREYIPAPKANFVKLVINGENWGVYANIQQYNKDFIQEWFGNRDGVRWKPSGGGGRRGGRGGDQGGSGSALNWSGSNIEDYKRSYQLKTKTAADTCWEDLINLCDKLNNTPADQLEATLNPILNIDSVLWHIALENVFIDEGYVSRGSDYYLYMTRNGRFQTMPYDNNETFRFAGGGGPDMRSSDGPMVSPVSQEDNERLPLVSRLLSVPSLRARYIAHVRTIMNEWLDWDNVGPIIEGYQSVIDSEVKADNKKLYTYEAFANSPTEDFSGGRPGGGGPPGVGFGRGGDFARGRGNRTGGRRGRGPGGGPGGGVTPSFKRFTTERQEFLSSHPEIDKPTPVIKSVSLPDDLTPAEDRSIQIKSQVAGDVGLDSVILYYASEADVPFETVKMLDDGDGIYSGEIPPLPAGTAARYYVEARAIASVGTTVFAPEKAELGAFVYKTAAKVAESTSVVINELMAFNTKSLTDPQGENDDWIELYNASDEEIDLSGMYLSDKKDNPRKWAFPENTVILPKGYLIVWADENGKAQPGLHASFKLSKSGEAVMLIDSDERGNAILDVVEFGQQEEDSAIGRFPNGIGEFTLLTMTPGEKNRQ